MPAAIKIKDWLKKEDTRQAGVIETINRRRGYGFIAADDERRYFFHMSTLENCRLHEVEEGQQVSFCLEDNGHKGGPRAINVTTN